MDTNTQQLLKYLAYSYRDKQFRHLESEICLTNVVTYNLSAGFCVGTKMFLQPLRCLHVYVHGVDCFVSRFRTHINRCGRSPVSYVDRGHFEVELRKDGSGILRISPVLHSELNHYVQQLRVIAA